MLSPVRQLTEALIARPSITPDDAGCLDLIGQRLAAVGMTLERFDEGGVSNLLAHHGSGGPHLLLLGHTDVVPPGPLGDWRSPPFEPTVFEGQLIGRGAADMKSSVAAFVIALEKFLQAWPDHPGTISLLLTSDEEGPAEHGVRIVVPQLQARGLLPDACLVGEPSSLKVLGDNLRIGRRGSIQARLSIRGRQGHTAYAEPADNPVHRAGDLLAALARLQFDDGDEHFPPSRLQISNVRAGTGAENVTPGELEVLFNIRNNPNSSAEALEQQLRGLIEQHQPGDWSLGWRVSGRPFGPATGSLPTVVVDACRRELGVTPRLDTGGGTSDGRFFGPLAIPVVELGPVNQTIHQVNEAIDLNALDALPRLYGAVIHDFLSGAGGG